MHLKSLALIATALVATASAIPAPDPIAVPEPNAVADAADASPSPKNPTDTSGFTAELHHEPGDKHCSLEFHLPSMGCDGGMQKVMKYGDGGPEKCWMECEFPYTESRYTHANGPGRLDDGHFSAIDSYSVCGSAHGSFDTNGQVQISNPEGQHAHFVFTLHDNMVDKLEIDPVKVDVVSD